METRFLKTRLRTLKKNFDTAVKECLKEMNLDLAENFFDNYAHVVELAVWEANTASKWHSPINRVLTHTYISMI